MLVGDRSFWTRQGIFFPLHIIFSEMWVVSQKVKPRSPTSLLTSLLVGEAKFQKNTLSHIVARTSNAAEDIHKATGLHSQPEMSILSPARPRLNPLLAWPAEESCCAGSTMTFPGMKGSHPRAAQLIPFGA